MSYVLDWAATRRRRVDWLIPYRAPVVAVSVITAILVASAYGMNHTGYIVWGGLWIAPVLLILSIPFANRAARLDGDAIGRIVLLGAGIKIFAAPLLRYWMAFNLYSGTSDSARYHVAGTDLAPLFRQWNYESLGHISGTRFLEILTGEVYAFIGPTRLGGCMVFSWFSFVGLYLFFRAFRTAVPQGDARRYALLLFFFPTLLFWPSSIGKEAFMVLVLGAAALGAVHLFAGRLRGLVWLALGMVGAVVVRPHMALIMGAGLVVAAPLAVLSGGGQDQLRNRGRLGSAVLLVAILFAGSGMIAVAEQFFGLKSLNTQTVQEQFDEVTRRSGEKGSTFTGYSPNSPVGFALAGVTVLFRPFPLEVRNPQGFLTSLEGLTLLGLCIVSLKRLSRLPREFFRRPYVVFSLVYVLAFVYAFSSIVNFGILARQRAQLLPILFVVLCLPRRDSVNADAPAPSELTASRRHW